MLLDPENRARYPKWLDNLGGSPGKLRIILGGTKARVMEPEIIKPGDDAGNRMVVKYTDDDGVVVYGIGVPQAWETRLGPTWSYVVEGDHLTLIDTGCNGSIQHLEEGLQIVGYPMSAVDRIVVTHGHLDHDGNCFDVVDRSGAELWAHEVYSELLGVNRWEKEMEWRRSSVGFPAAGDTEFVNRVQEYHRMSGRLKVNNVITDGLVADGLTFYYTPGHSPDELCILFRRVLFSGDHILPQITPHPSVSLSYKSFQTMLPESYQRQNTCYGLRIFLKSLKRVANLGAILVSFRPTGPSTGADSTSSAWSGLEKSWSITAPGATG